MKITPKTALTDLKFPFLEVVLDEIFYLPPHALFPEEPPPPTTVGELAARVNLNIDKTIHLLRKTWEMGQGIEMDRIAWEREKDSYFVVSVGTDPVAEPLPRFNLNDVFLIDHLEELKEAPVLVVSQDQPRAFSAAMYLRSIGVRASFLKDC